MSLARAARRTIAAATIVLLLTAGAAAAAPAHAAPSGHGKRVYLAQGFSGMNPVYRPKLIVASGDASFVIQHVHWAMWNQTKARGHGTAAADNCTPSCAQGHYRKDPVHIKLVKPRHVCGRMFFVKMLLHYTGKKFPSSINRHQVYFMRPDDCTAANFRPAAAAQRGPRI